MRAVAVIICVPCDVAPELLLINKHVIRSHHAHRLEDRPLEIPWLCQRGINENLKVRSIASLVLWWPCLPLHRNMFRSLAVALLLCSNYVFAEPAALKRFVLHCPTFDCGNPIHFPSIETAFAEPKSPMRRSRLLRFTSRSTRSSLTASPHPLSTCTGTSFRVAPHWPLATYRNCRLFSPGAAVADDFAVIRRSPPRSES